MPFISKRKILPACKHFSCIILFLCYTCKGLAQEYKQTKSGELYYEKNGRFIFPGNLVAYDTLNKARQPRQLSFLSKGSPTKVGNEEKNNFESLGNSSAIVLNITTTQPTCGYSSGSIIVEATNGTPPYSYTRIDQYSSYTQMTGNFPVAIAGTYLMRVKDANGLSGEQTVTLTNISPGPVMLTLESIKAPSVCNVKDGSLKLRASGGTPPYSYSMDRINWQASNEFTNLYQGGYTFFVKDANGCIASHFTLGTFNATYSCTDNGLIGGGSGTACGTNSFAEIKMLGNNGPYQYSLDGVNYQADGRFSNIGPGVYQFFIKKANGEVVAWGFNRGEYCALYIEYVAVSASCFGSNGELEVIASQGKAPYQYSIDGINYQTSNIFSNLSPGNYSVTVRDDIGTKSSIRATVFDKCPIVNAVTTAESCAGNDGTVTAGGFRGTEPYRFSIDGVNFQTSPDFTGLKKGAYTITIKDDLGFTGTTTATVGYSCLQMQVDAVDATCNLSNGTINITASNGVLPYQYSIDGINFVSSNEFKNLAPASYTVVVKDAANKIVTQTIVINAVSVPGLQIDTTAASCARNDASLSLSVTGGVAPYLYSFNGVQYNSIVSLTGVRADSLITAFVKDKNGCISSKSFTISAHCPVITVTSRPEVCNLGDGVLTVAASAGFGPYQYSLDNINFQSSNVFNNLTEGSYKVYVRDASMIINVINASIAKSCTTASATVANETCDYANGSVLINASNGTAPYTYSLDNINFQTSNSFTGLKQGNYTITVRDALQTNYALNVVITNSPGPGLTVNSLPVSCLNNDGKLELTASGGKTPYTFSIDGTTFINSSSFAGLSKGIYQVYVKDANGCTTEKSVPVDLVSDLTLSITRNETICEGSSVQLNAVSNGTQFSWQPASTLDNSSILKPTAKPVVSTRYFLEVSKGICKIADSVDVRVNPAPVALAKGDTTICYGQNALLTGEGGVQFFWSPLSYLDNNSSSTVSVNSPDATTTYKLKVVDALGCSSLNNAPVTVTVKPPSKLFAGNDTSIAKGEALPLFARDINNTGFVYFDWQPRTGLTDGQIQNPVTILSNDITYKVMATTIEGCKVFDTIKITVFDKPEIYVPSGFTPNGDGLNDQLVAIPIGIKTFTYFKVYNRWGQEVFSTTEHRKGWSGAFRGEGQMPGIYTWVAAGVDFKGDTIYRKGIVTLIR
jgi:gliding motility-associated-like protein